MVVGSAPGRLLLGLTLVSALVLVYLLWALDRLRPGTMIADGASWPRAFPYPDRWLLALNDYYDRQHPAAPGTIKLEGELERVQITVLLGCVLFAALMGIGAVLAFRDWRRSLPSRCRGFPIVAVRHTGQRSRQ